MWGNSDAEHFLCPSFCDIAKLLAAHGPACIVRTIVGGEEKGNAAIPDKIGTSFMYILRDRFESSGGKRNCVFLAKLVVADDQTSAGI